jgi:hypothetical protein
MGASIFLVKMNLLKKLRIDSPLHLFIVAIGIHLAIYWIRSFCQVTLNYTK